MGVSRSKQGAENVHVSSYSQHRLRLQGVRFSAMAKGTSGQRTAGSVQLLRVLQRTTRTALSAKLHVSRASVGYWASGRSRPDYQQRRTCQRELGIPLDAWDQAPAAAAASAVAA